MSEKEAATRPEATVRRIGPESISFAAERAQAQLVGVVSDRFFERECLVAALKNLLPGIEFCGYESGAAWQKDTAGKTRADVVVYSIGTARLDDEGVKETLQAFISRAAPRRVIVLGEHDDASSFFEAIDCGAVGYISSSVGLEDLAAAIRGSSSRSVLIPRKSILALRKAVPIAREEQNGLERFFTDRQLDVARALQKGAANKTIAHELNLCESTVKVHIRNIMRKLKATNRTQAAFRLNQITDGTYTPEDDARGG